jgi:transcriptional regulator with XRE-family HTH domain
MKVKHTVQKEYPRLSSKIRKAREKHDLTTVEAAKLFEMSRQNLDNLESGSMRGVPLTTLRRIERALGEDFEVDLGVDEDEE